MVRRFSIPGTCVLRSIGTYGFRPDPTPTCSELPEQGPSESGKLVAAWLSEPCGEAAKSIASGASLYTLAPSKSFGLCPSSWFCGTKPPRHEDANQCPRSGSECQSGLECSALAGRGIAQPGSAPALGAGGLRFKSGCPDRNRQPASRLPNSVWSTSIFVVRHRS